MKSLLMLRRFFLFLFAFNFFACLGGENETATVVQRSKEFRLPALKAGDTWVVEESGSDFEEATSTFSILDDDTVYGGEPAYLAVLNATIAKYATARGDSVWNFIQTGTLFMRKSDQEAVYDSVEVNSQVRLAGDTGVTAYRLMSVTTTAPQASNPDPLRPGLEWSIAYAKTRKSSYTLDGAAGDSLDTAWTEIRDYRTGEARDVAVAAGTFYCIGIEWTRAATGEASKAWFSEAARTIVKEEKYEAGLLTGRYELTSLMLK